MDGVGVTDAVGVCVGVADELWDAELLAVCEAVGASEEDCVWDSVSAVATADANNARATRRRDISAPPQEQVRALKAATRCG